MHTNPNKLDCAIIGAGPAGLMAAVQASRLGLGFKIFERRVPGGQALAANWIENFPGFPEGISGHDLMERMLNQVSAHGIEIRNREVLRVESSHEFFTLCTAEGDVSAKTVIVAAGLVPKRLNIPGEDELAGTRLFSYVDPALVPHDGRSVMIIGDGDAAFDQALYYSRSAKNVSIMMKHGSPRCAPLLAARAKKAGIEILSSRVASRLEDQRDRVGIFFECAGEESQLYAHLVIACAGKEKKLDFIAPELMREDARGIFYAGDCRMGRMGHIAIACGEGIQAAMEAARYLTWKNL